MSPQRRAHVALVQADLAAIAGVHGFTTLRSGAGISKPPFDTFNLGNRSAADGDVTDIVECNRRELVDIASLPSTPRWLRQVHGTRVLRFDGDDAARSGAAHAAAADEPEADASVTRAAGVVLAILTADCLPVLFAARDGREVGAAHAGWRGLAGGVLEATVAAMHAPADQIAAWLGPAAGPAHYEVGVDVYDAFVASHWADGAAFTSTRPLHWRVDLYALARRRLVSAGLHPSNIAGGGLCTISDGARFYSHRRHRSTGRMASLVWIDHADG